MILFCTRYAVLDRQKANAYSLLYSEATKTSYGSIVCFSAELLYVDLLLQYYRYSVSSLQQ